jgi:cell division protein FtsZ
MEDLITELGDSNMVFITAGMGGGTGTGAAPVIAQAARERGILTVGVITKPFHFEGAHRMRTAEQGIEELSQYVDTLIIIPNQNLFRIANEKTTFADAFHMADNVLHQGVRGVTDLMVMPGLINLDFADIRTVMSEMGKAMMGTGEASGEKRALEAAESAISNPLLDDMSMKGARGVLINITGGMDMTLFEVDEAANRMREEVDADANIIFGSTFDEKLDGMMRVSVVATGIAAEGLAAKPRPQMTLVSSRAKQTLAPEPETEIVITAVTPASDSEPELRTGTDDAPVISDAVANSIATAEAKLAATASIAGQMGEIATPIDTASRFEKSNEAYGMSAEDIVADAMPAPAEVAIKSVVARPADDPFVAPPAVVLNKQPQAASWASADPFNAAAMANAGSTSARAPSLFQRVTGMGRKVREEVEPQSDLLVPATSELARPTVPVAQSADDSAKLGLLDRADRVAPSRADDDLLDIPAFLRRQAN